MSVAVGNSLSEFWTDMCSRWLSPCDDSKRLCSLMIYCCISEIDILGFPGGSDDKASVCNAGDLGSIPGLGRSPGQGNGSPLQYSCPKIPWTAEPGRLLSMGSQRVGHDWAKGRRILSLHLLSKTSCSPYMEEQTEDWGGLKLAHRSRVSKKA